MRCTTCGNDNREGRRFCVQCGRPLKLACPSCGASTEPTEKFCGDCGAALSQPTATPRSTEPEAAPAIDEHGEISEIPEGERRHLTVLFCDLVGSTEIASHLDPEEWREIVREYHRAAAQAVERFGGSVAQYLGDGVMAYFGWPEAHDNDAERGARAGLAILDAISKLNKHPTHPKLAARVGIDSGAVVVGSGTGKEADVFGDTPNIAARVQAAAEPGTEVMTDAVHRLVSGLFVVEDRGAQALKGIERPVQIYRVVEPSGVRGRLQAVAASRGLTPFVGREDELRLLMSRWERALEGEGQVALIIGEAGIGKSRFVQRFHELIAGTPHTWVEAGAGAFYQNTPFYPFTEMLREFVAWRGDEPAEEQLARLESALELAGLKPAEAIPLLAPLLDSPLPAKYPPSPLSPEQQRRRLLAMLVGWVAGAARVQPLIIATEDLHWADPSTLELIQLLVEQGTTARLLLLYTARPEFRPPWPPRTHHIQLTLNRLSARNVRTMVEEVAARVALSAESIAAVVERTGGVPLFVEEMTRAVLESGDAKLTVHQIPVTLQDSLMARLDRLGPAKEVLQIGAVLGSDFSHALLNVVHPIPESELQQALRTLSDTELLRVHGIAPDATYQFKHALIRDAAYEALLKTRRRELHRRVADALRQHFQDVAEEQPEILAQHYTEAGLLGEAVSQYLQAGERMCQRSAHVEAIRHLTKGLGLLATMPEGRDRVQQELMLQMTLGTSLLATRGFGSTEAGQAYTRAHELCQQLGEKQQLFPVLAGLRSCYVAQGNLQAARRVGEQLLQLAQSTGDPALVMEGHYALAVPLHLLGEFISAHEHCDRAIALCEPQHNRSRSFLFGLESRVASRSLAGWLLWELGYPERALQQSHYALSLARQVSHPLTLANALVFAGLTQMWCGHPQPALECAEELIAIAMENGFSSFSAMGSLLRGWTLTAQGREDEGIALILEGIAGWRATGARGNGTGHLAVLIAAYLKRGKIEAIMPVLSEALAMVESIGERNNESRLHQLKGEFARARGTVGELDAERSFGTAIRIAQNQSAKSLELRSTTSLARLLRDTNRRDEARAMLTEIYNWFTEGFDTADLKDAKALLKELNS